MSEKYQKKQEEQKRKQAAVQDAWRFLFLASSHNAEVGETGYAATLLGVCTKLVEAFPEYLGGTTS